MKLPYTFKELRKSACSYTVLECSTTGHHEEVQWAQFDGEKRDISSKFIILSVCVSGVFSLLEIDVSFFWK